MAFFLETWESTIEFGSSKVQHSVQSLGQSKSDQKHWTLQLMNSCWIHLEFWARGSYKMGDSFHVFFSTVKQYFQVVSSFHDQSNNIFEFFLLVDSWTLNMKCIIRCDRMKWYWKAKPLWAPCLGRGWIHPSKPSEGSTNKWGENKEKQENDREWEWFRKQPCISWKFGHPNFRDQFEGIYIFFGFKAKRSGSQKTLAPNPFYPTLQVVSLSFTDQTTKFGEHFQLVEIVLKYMCIMLYGTCVKCIS